jgi:branched-chain amino acid transport system substrate-binding protein
MGGMMHRLLRPGSKAMPGGAMKDKQLRPLTLLLVAALAVAAIFAGSCGSSKENAGGGQTAVPGDTTGVSDTEIKLGSLLPLTGVAAQWGVPMGQGMKAYFDYINDQGGIYGRKIQLDIGDSQYTGSVASEAVRKLVEQDGVFAFIGNLGTAAEAAVCTYLEERGIPDMFVLSGASQFTVPIGKNRFTAMVDYTTEGKIFATYLDKTYPGKKLGILAQNDDYGKEGEAGTRQGLKDLNSKMEVTTQYFDPTVTDVTAQMQRLQVDNVDVIMFWGGPLQAANMMKTARETLNWDVPMVINEANSGASLAVLSGIDNMEGVVGAAVGHLSGETDIPGIASRKAIVAKYAPDVTWDDMVLAGYTTAESFVGLLKQAGQNLSRESLIAAAESVCNYSTDLSLAPESTSPTDHRFLEAEILVKATVDRSGPTPILSMVPFGDPIGFESTTNCKVPTPPAGAEDQPGLSLGGQNE